jgi:hypothetical protein
LVRSPAPCSLRSHHHSDHPNLRFCDGWRSTAGKPLCFEKGFPQTSLGACFQFSPNIQNLPWFKWLRTPRQSCAPSTGACPLFAGHPRRMCGPKRRRPTHTPCLSFHCHFKQSIEAHALPPVSFVDRHRLVRALLTRPFVLPGRHQQGLAGQHRILDQIPCLSSP